MKFVKYVLFVLIAGSVLSACKKNDYDAAKQLQADEVLIKEFIAASDAEFQRQEDGVYYQIIRPGTGDVEYSRNTRISVKYTGRLLNGQIFDQGSFADMPLGNLITGWHIGVPLIQKGGRIRILVPSPYGYGPNAAGTIPPNSVLDFDIELIDVKN
ncbi:MAG TPA: FKBP-type peptidyl-prolyl cis-trans isomerase [Sphingobacteriaceae bacterium]